jgi:dihydrofolate reductase
VLLATVRSPTDRPELGAGVTGTPALAQQREDTRGSRKIILLEHVSLDGFLAGPNGEMDWIRVEDPAMWDDVTALTDAADTAIFGRTTYQMMEAYWPTAGDAPGASQHDIDHSRWLNSSTVIVVSRTLESARWGALGQAQVVKDTAALRALKEQAGANMLLIGSASVARECARSG